MSHGIVTALAPARLFVGLLCVLAFALLGWGLDRAYLAAGGRSAPPDGAPLRAENPLLDAERIARRTASTFVAGTTVAPQVNGETPLSTLRTLVDVAGVEKLAAAGDAERMRSTYLLEWDRTTAALERARPRGPAEYLASGWSSATRRLVAGLVGWSPVEMGGALMDGMVRAPADSLALSPWWGGLWLVVGVVMLATIGGALGRMSAMEAARGEKITASVALAWLRRSVLRCACVPLAPMAIAALLFLVVLLFGGLLRLPGLDLLAGLLYVVVLLSTTLALVMGAAALLGLPMAIAAVASGDADAMDATVRATAYIFRAPFRTLGLAAVGVASVGFGVLVVGACVATALAASSWGVGVLGGAGAATAAGGPSIFSEGGRALGEASARLSGVTARPAAAFIDLWEAGFAMLVVGYALSAISETGTRIYLVLRLVCDGEDPSSIDGHSLGRPAATPPANA